MPSLKKLVFKPLNVLITSGPVSVPIDDVRFITNSSTGEMGRRIAAAMLAIGAKVTLLEGQVVTSFPIPKGVTLKKFVFFDDFSRTLKIFLENDFNLVVHAAAVADWAPVKRWKGKISSKESLSLEFKPTPKLINLIKKKSRGMLRLIAFKFETTLSLEQMYPKARKLINEADADLVVLNRQNTMGYEACLYRPDDSVTKGVNSKESLVSLLINDLPRLMKQKVGGI